MAGRIMSMKNSSDPTGNRSHLQALNFVLERQVKTMANLRVLQKGQYLKCDPNKSWRITVTEYACWMFTGQYFVLHLDL